jgi:NAD(P) transhydrogenase subunit alpha
MKPGQVLIGQFNLLGKADMVEALRAADLSVFSLDLAPRTTRAQAIDVLSSMATVAGYKAVLMAATHLPGFFPMLMTAAGAVKPAKLLVLGAGVAGLQAIATARRLGAVVEAFDVRRAAKEEVLSLGARFVEVEGAQDDSKAGGYAVEQSEDFQRRQAELIHQHAIQADVVICTAQIPGKKSPLLLPESTLEHMKPGAVIVDLAASGGGNSAWTVNNETVYRNGLCIIGDSNLPASLPRDASNMFSKNVLNFIKLLAPKGEVVFNFDDDILAGACVAHQLSVISPRLQTLLPA